MPISPDSDFVVRGPAEWLGRFRLDLKVAIRSLRRAPVFTTAMIGVLGLGIGASTAMFTVFKTVLVERLPIVAQERLVVMHPLDRGGAHLDVPYPYLATIARDSDLFRGVAGIYHLGAAATPFVDGDRSIELIAASASPNFFEVIGARPSVGRLFAHEDGAKGAPPSIVLSYAAWRRRFDGDRAIVGRTLVMPYTEQEARIVGVAPAGFEYPAGTDAWVTLSFDFAAQVDVIARLAPRTTLDAARSGLFALTQRLNPFSTVPSAPGAKPVFVPVSGVEVQSIADIILGDARPAIRALTLAVALLLLIACVNAGNLILVRLLGRVREVAVRRAIGASYGDVIRLFLVENSMLASAGGVAGLVVGVVLLRLVHATAPPQLPRSDALRVFATPVGMAASVTVIALLLFGLAPSLLASRLSTYAALRSDTRSGTGSRASRRGARWLVASQMALALVLVASATLLVRSFEQLASMSLGYVPDHVSLLSFTAPKSDLSTPTLIGDAGRRLVARIEAIPGVVAAADVENRPFKGQSFFIMKVAPSTAPVTDRDHYPFVPFEFVGADYFRTFLIPVLRGRGFRPSDNKQAPRVVVISETLARRLWPNEDAIGKQLVATGDGSGWTVVGVAGDTHFREFRNTGPVVYFESEQVDYTFGSGFLAIRTSGSLAATLPALRAATREVDPRLVIWDAETMDQLLDEPMMQPKLSALLLSGIGLFALLLSAIGLYGVLAAVVRQQTRAIGVRIALGATSRDVARFVLDDAMRMVAAGAIIGAVGALGAGRVLASQLFGVKPTDPMSLAIALVVLLSVGAAAALLPASRAARLDPVEALRAD
jgi:putative ABC transport system permease protein